MNKTTYFAKPGEVERKWHVVDATDIPLGRLSAVVASILRGKNKHNTHFIQILAISLSLLMLDK